MINCIDGQYGKEQLKKWAQKSILLCPVCDKPYEYCHGKVKTPYFRHKDKAQCEYDYAEPETEEHLNGKKDLYKWLLKQKDVTDVVLEGWLPETRQRPDLMFTYNGEKWVIEYQCSPIATEYLERHELYQAAGIHDIWICGTEKYMKDNMRDKVSEQYYDGYYDTASRRFIFPLDERKYSDLLKLVFKHNKSNGKKMQSWLKCSVYRARFRKYFAVELNGMTFCNGKMVLSKFLTDNSINIVANRIAQRNKLRGRISYLPCNKNKMVERLSNIFKHKNIAFTLGHPKLEKRLRVSYRCGGSIGTLERVTWYSLPQSYKDKKILIKSINDFCHATHTIYNTTLFNVDSFLDKCKRRITLYIPQQGDNTIFDELELVMYMMVSEQHDIRNLGAYYQLPHFVTHIDGQTIDLTKVSHKYIRNAFKKIGFVEVHIKTEKDTIDRLEEIN